jgi:hypothetical protein
MATILKAGNVASGAQITSDATGILEIRTGTGAGTTAITVGTNQAVTIGGNNISAVNSLGFRNRIINGDMRIDQRNNGASVTPANSAYTLDRWMARSTQASKYSVEQTIAGVAAPAGFTDYLGVTSLSAYSVGASDFFFVAQLIEGFNAADLAWGTANAQTVTLSFWVRSSLTGTFGGSVRAGGSTRSYPFSYTISAANTWEQKTVTIAGDTSGTWNTNNTTWGEIDFALGAGGNFSGTAGAWSGSTLVSATGATSVVGTNGATFYITGVQLEAGSVATPFERRDYGRELIMCQRYCNVLRPNASASGLFSGLWFSATSVLVTYTYPVVMRASPTATVSAASDFICVGGANADAASSVTASGTSTTNTRFGFVSSVSRTQGQGAIIQSDTSAAVLTLSAEL